MKKQVVHKHRYLVSKDGIDHAFYVLGDVAKFLFVARIKVVNALKDNTLLKGYSIVEDDTYEPVKMPIEEAPKPKKFLLTMRFANLNEIARLIGRSELYCTQLFAGTRKEEDIDIDEVCV